MEEGGGKGEKLWGKTFGRVLAVAPSPQPCLSPQVAASAFSPPPWPTTTTSPARPQWAVTQEAGAGRKWLPGRLAGMLGKQQQNGARPPTPPNLNR